LCVSPEDWLPLDAPLPPAVLAAIERCLPAASEEPRRCLFRLARRIRTLIDPSDLNSLLRCFRQWYDRRPTPKPPFTAEAAQAFVQAVRSVRKPHGQAWAAALERSRSTPVPPELQTPTLGRLAAVLIALSEAWGGGEFHVSLRDLEAVTGIPFKTVHRYLGAICGLGFLELVDPGDIAPAGGRSNTYLWHDPPVKGGAPWAKRTTRGSAGRARPERRPL
jgi:hypothetical protein